MIAQAAPIERNPRYRKSSGSAWPIRLPDGSTPAERREREKRT